MRRGKVNNKVLSGGEALSVSVHKRLDGVGSSGGVAWGQVDSFMKLHGVVILFGTVDCH